jgi:D-3-phosphoglycerate dehydrogenase
MNALILAPFSPRYVGRLRQQFDVTYEPWTETKFLHPPDKLAARIRDQQIEALVVEADFLLAQVFEARPLKIAGVCRNSLSQVDLDAATEHGVLVTHSTGRNNQAVAELAIGLMLALARHIPQAHSYVAAGEWRNPMEAYTRFQGRELGGSVAGIVGLGQIGREVAKRCAALGARVLATDPYVTPKQAQAAGARLTPLRELLRKSDFVTLHLPQSPKVDGLISAERLDLLKPDARLINTGYPGSLDYAALAERVKAGRIAGAALDVFPGFVLAQDSPLRELDNVILTPHIGGATPETIERHSRMITDDIERFLRGAKPRHLVNPAVLKEVSSVR